MPILFSEQASPSDFDISSDEFVVVITSVIRTINPYREVAGEYTCEERYTHTLKTLQSLELLRQAGYSMKIVLLEGSMTLTDEQWTTLDQKCDYVIAFKDAPERGRHFIHESLQKSMGEIYTLLKFAELMKPHQFSHLVKITGRYWIDKSSNMHQFIKNVPTFHRIFVPQSLEADKWEIFSLFYTIPHHYLEKYWATLRHYFPSHHSAEFITKRFTEHYPEISYDVPNVKGFISRYRMERPWSLRPKLMVVGSTGMLGTYLVAYLSRDFKVIPLNRTDIDVEASPEKIQPIIEMHTPDYVINAVGLIPHAGKFSKDQYQHVNTDWPILLGKICTKHNARLIHIATDCVFSGNRGSYAETDLPDATSVYGKSKIGGDQCDAMVLRTSIIGENYKGYSLIEWVKSNHTRQIDGYTSHKWNGMTCLQLAKYIREIIDQYVWRKETFHLVSESVSKFALVKLIQEVYELDITITPVITSICIDRTLQTNKVLPITPPPSLRDQLLELRQFNRLKQDA